MLRNMSSNFGPVEHFAALEEFGRAMADKELDESRIAKARRALVDTVGKDGFVDACGVVGMFTSITKVVDITGHRSPLKLKAALHISHGLVAARRNSVPLALSLVVIVLLFLVLVVPG